MANIKDIINFIKINGNNGSADDEKYVDINETIVDKTYGEVLQVCYFSDTDELLVYMGNAYTNDDYVSDCQFVSYDDLSDKTKTAIENLPIWD